MQIQGSATLKTLKEVHSVKWADNAKFKLTPRLIEYLVNSYKPHGMFASILECAREWKPISMRQLYVIQKCTHKPYTRRFRW